MKGCYFLMASVLALAGCGTMYEPDRPPEKVLLPDGFVGWTRLDYGVPGAAPLPRDGDYVIVRYPADGHAVTSSLLTGTTGLSEVHYYSADATIRAPAGFSATGGFTRGRGEPDERITWFRFYGTKADATAAEAARDRDADVPTMGSVVASRRQITKHSE
jgi:hypothetical protein